MCSDDSAPYFQFNKLRTNVVLLPTLLLIAQYDILGFYPVEDCSSLHQLRTRTATLFNPFMFKVPK